MAVPSPHVWQSPGFQKQFLKSLSNLNKGLDKKRASWARIYKWKPKMASGLFNPSAWIGISGNTSNNVFINTASTTTSTFTPSAYYLQMQQAMNQQMANVYQQQMAQAQQAYGIGGSGGLGTIGGSGGATVNPPNQILTDDVAIAHLQHKDHIVLKKLHRAVHAPLSMPFPFKPDDPVKLNVREVHGYALPSKAGEYVMPDGSVLLVDDYGNYRIEDHNAKVTYKACRVREFNPYINASDLLEAFVAAVGKHPLVDQANVLKLPIEAFINWLIRQAAEKDGDSLEGLPKVEDALKALPAPVAQAA